MAKILVVANRKGGVGKTTIATHLSAGLAIRGKRVIAVDSDSQGHFIQSFGTNQKAPQFYKLMNATSVDDINIEDVITPIPHEAIADENYYQVNGELYVVRGDDTTSLLTMSPNVVQNVFMFLERMQWLGDQGDIDYIIVDTPPTTSLMDSPIYMAANYLLYVSEASGLAIDGLVSAMNNLKRITESKKRYTGHDTHILGCVVNKIDTRTHLHRFNASAIAAYPALKDAPVMAAITKRIAYEEAVNELQTVFKYQPGTGFAKEQLKVVDAVIKATEERHAEAVS